MATTVFGNPITNATLEVMPEYRGKNITRTDRAHVALSMKNKGDKDMKARKYVQDLQNDWGTGDSTQCLIYNATGDRLTFTLYHDFQGSLGVAPYPVYIENGQWGAFHHVSWTFTGSIGAVVYRGKNEPGDEFECLLSWCNPYNKSSYNSAAYTDIHASDYFSGVNWNQISDKLQASTLVHSSEWRGCKVFASMGRMDSAVFEGVITLSNA
ncbi:23 kDa jasmonate-induced protein-like [Actinidia eriantha]|uniref:23 kDa jasmonate-induced protein-like n=1 Tax=Actinidia eriantha TaxID=165200 RepID=UPI002585CB9B|nr:23 kDa jasmonate-induced protein-like [Actinidia eriantha]XP_057498163.1 23 kDa jasmonate-induced protein-like [Actinidia eriantha]